MRLVSMLPLALVLGTTACSPGEKAAETKPAAAAAAPETASPAATPQIDVATLQAKLSPDTALEVLTLDESGSAKVSGEVKGYKAPAYAVAAAPGQTLTVAFTTTSSNLYMNVVDAADATGAAAHRGEFDGATATLSPTRPTIYLIEPFQPRATARRGEAGAFEIAVTRK